VEIGLEQLLRLKAAEMILLGSHDWILDKLRHLPKWRYFCNTYELQQTELITSMCALLYWCH